MPILAHIVIPDFSPEQYDAVRTAAGWLTDTPAGELAHLTWWEDDDCHSFDCWESSTALEEFERDRLTPAMGKVGIDRTPQITIHEMHEAFLPRVAVVASTAAPERPLDNVAILRAGYHSFARGEIGDVLSRFDRRIVWYTPDSIRHGGTYTGHEGVAAYFATLPDNYLELHVDPRSFIAEGDTVVVQGAHRGRSRSGRKLLVPFVHVWRMVDGKAIAFTEYLDTVKLNLALGLPAQRVDLTEPQRRSSSRSSPTV